MEYSRHSEQCLGVLALLAIEMLSSSFVVYERQMIS